MERQTQREKKDWTLATQVERMRVQSKIEKGQEYEFNYGKEVVKKVLPFANEFFTSEPNIRFFKTTVKPLIVFKKEDKPIEKMCDMVALVMASHLSKNVPLTALSKEMATNFFYIFSIPFKSQDELMHDAMAFFQTTIEHISHRSGVFVVEQIFNDQYFVRVSDQYKQLVDNGVMKALEIEKSVYKPMVCKPMPIHNLTDGDSGYLFLQSPVYKHPHTVKGKVNKIITDVNDNTNETLFNTMNKVQNTPFCINEKVYSVLVKYKEMGKFFKGYAYELEQCLEDYKAEAIKEINERNERRKRYANKAGIEYSPLSDATVKEAMDEAEDKAVAEVRKVKHTMAQALEDIKEPELYFPFHMDFRGRRYPYALYGITYMGDELGKSLVQFANKKKLTKRGVLELFSTLSNTLGHDKKRYEVKMKLVSEWYKKHRADFLDGKYDLFFDEQDEFEEPINALAIVLELVEWEKDKSYLCGYIAHRDARCSGASIIGTMLNDKTVMELTSVYEPLNIDEKAPEKLPDAYLHGAATAIAICTERAEKGSEVASTLLQYQDVLFTRNVFKKPVMTRASYGLTEYALKEGNKELFKEIGFGEGHDLGFDHLNEYNDIMLKALEISLPSCSYFLKKMKEVANDVCDNNGGVISFVDPLTGLPCVWQEFEEKKKQLAIKTPFRTISTVIYKKTDKVDKRGTVNGFSPNLVHHVDSTILLEVSKLTDCDLATIHDSIGSHPNDVTDVRMAYNKVMAVLNKTDYLNSILSQFSTVRVDKMEGEVDVNCILNSKHSIA